MYYYRIHGCGVESSFPLLTETSNLPGAVDVHVSTGVSHQEIDWFHQIEENGDRLVFGRAADDFYLELPDLYRYRIAKDGSRILVDPLGDYSTSVQSGLLISQALPLALHLKGHTIIHASAVARGMNAVAFLGRQTMGKSTLAMACVENGFKLISDDGLRVDPGAQPQVFLSVPEIRVEPEVVKCFPGLSDKGVEVFDKLRLTIDQAHCCERAGLSHLFVLEEGDTPELRLCDTSEVLETVLSNCFRIDFENQQRITEEFEKIAALLGSVELKILSYPRELSRIGEVVQLVCDLF